MGVCPLGFCPQCWHSRVHNSKDPVSWLIPFRAQGSAFLHLSPHVPEISAARSKDLWVILLLKSEIDTTLKYRKDLCNERTDVWQNKLISFSNLINSSDASFSSSAEHPLSCSSSCCSEGFGRYSWISMTLSTLTNGSSSNNSCNP